MVLEKTRPQSSATPWEILIKKTNTCIECKPLYLEKELYVHVMTMCYYTIMYNKGSSLNFITKPSTQEKLK